MTLERIIDQLLKGVAQCFTGVRDACQNNLVYVNGVRLTQEEIQVRLQGTLAHFADRCVTLQLVIMIPSALCGWRAPHRTVC
jgi:hypothetical protein